MSACMRTKLGLLKASNTTKSSNIAGSVGSALIPSAPIEVSPNPTPNPIPIPILIPHPYLYRYTNLYRLCICMYVGVYRIWIK